MANFTFWRGRELKTTTFFFFSWTSIQSFYNSAPENIANIWRIEPHGISAIKFEAARLHFLSDVFVADAIVAAQAPFLKLPNNMNPLTHWPIRDSIRSNDHPFLKEKLVY